MLGNSSAKSVVVHIVLLCELVRGPNNEFETVDRDAEGLEGGFEEVRIVGDSVGDKFQWGLEVIEERVDVYEGIH